jgi:hypothetical protein
MKHRILFSALVFAVCAGTFTSCKDMAVSTPELWAAKLMIRTAPDGWCDTIPATDTIQVGDTLRWNMHASGVFNTLQSFEATCDTSVFYLGLEVDSAYLDTLAEGTDLDRGKLVFLPAKIYDFPFWLRFIPRKTGTHKIQFVIASDAGEGYSPRSWEYTANISDSIPVIVPDTTQS